MLTAGVFAVMVHAVSMLQLQIRDWQRQGLFLCNASGPTQKCGSLYTGVCKGHLVWMNHPAGVLNDIEKEQIMVIKLSCRVVTGRQFAHQDANVQYSVQWS